MKKSKTIIISLSAIILALIAVVIFLIINKSTGNSSKIVGKYVSIRDSRSYIEFYSDGTCYYHPYDYTECYDSSYRVTHDNTIRIEYAEYDIVYERETHDADEYTIVNQNSIRSTTGEMFYKK